MITRGYYFREYNSHINGALTKQEDVNLPIRIISIPRNFFTKIIFSSIVSKFTISRETLFKKTKEKFT